MEEFGREYFSQIEHLGLTSSVIPKGKFLDSEWKSLLSDEEKYSLSFVTLNGVSFTKDMKLEKGRVDFFVLNEVILELKAVESMNKVFDTILLTYLKALE